MKINRIGTLFLTLAFLATPLSYVYAANLGALLGGSSKGAKYEKCKKKEKKKCYAKNPGAKEGQKYTKLPAKKGECKSIAKKKSEIAKLKLKLRKAKKSKDKKKYTLKLAKAKKSLSKAVAACNAYTKNFNKFKGVNARFASCYKAGKKYCKRKYK